MELSVIIPCYNAVGTVATQLEALAAQRWSKPWEVIVADNGSTDRSMTIVEQYRERLPHLRIIDASARRGSAYAMNVGAQAAAGDALAFCDADDEVAPGWVAAMGNALCQYDFVAGRLEGAKLNQSWVRDSRTCPQQDGLQEYDYPPFLPHAASCNLGIKRSLYQAIGEFAEFFSPLQDTDYCWRVQLAGTELRFVPDAVVHYRFRNTLRGIYRQASSYGVQNVLLYKKYRPLGMPMLSWKMGVKSWRYLLRSLPRIRSKADLGRWVWQLGWLVGRLRGSVKYRVLAL
jgi:glycosyltransferase involved in cell wall biosynthesis